MSTQYIKYPTTGGVPTYANFAAFPATAADGSLAVALDSDTLYVYSASAVMWLPIGTPGDVLAVGTIDSTTASPNGAAINLGNLIMQSASATVPGLVNNSAQTFTGVKDFASNLGVGTASPTLVGSGTELTIANSTFGLLNLQRSGAATTNADVGAISGFNAATRIAIIEMKADGATDSGQIVLTTKPTGGAALTAVTISSNQNVTIAGTVAASNFSGSSSGSNTGDVTLAAVGAVPNANGASLSGQILNLQPADATHPGALTAADWNTFNNKQPAGSYITALTGDVVAAGPGSSAATIQANVVSNAKLAQMPTLTIKGNNSGITANAADLTVAQVNAILPVFTSTLNGLVPLSGGGSANFLRADGTFAVPPGTGISTTLTSAHILVGNGSNIATDVAVSGDLSLDNTGAFTIANSAVTNVKMANMAANTAKANITGSSAAPSDVAAVSTATASSFVVRDASANFAAGTITAAQLIDSGLTANTAIYADGSKQLASSATTATELGYVSGVTSAIQTQINTKSPIILPSANQMVYVNFLTGSDSTGTGAYAAPYKTVAFAMTTITDADSNKPYVVALQAERQVESTDVFMKPYTFIVGMGQRATYMRINGGSLKPATTHSSVNSWVGLFNLYWGGSSVINWDLQALGGANCVFIIQNCTVTGSFTYKGRNSGGGDSLEVYTGIMFGPVVLDSLNVQIQSVEMIGAVTLTNTQAISMALTFDNLVFDTSLAITSVGTAQLNNCAYGSGVTLTTTGTVGITSFRGLPVTANRSLSGGTTVTYLDDATIVHYVPATSGNWATPPTDASLALDSLAASGIVKSQTQNLVFASPNGSSGVPSFRALVSADLPAISPASLTLTQNHILVGNASNAGVDVAMSGDVSIVASGATTIQSNVVSNAKLAQMATLTIKGNNTGGTADALDLTVSQVQTMLSIPTSSSPLPTLSGGTGTSATFTPGSVLYVDSSGHFTQDNSNFFWDATNKRLSLQGHLSTAAFGVAATGTEVGVSITSTASNTALDVQNQGAQFVAQFTNSTDSATQGAAFGGAFSRGSTGARTASLAGDQLMTFTGQGYNGTTFGPGYSGAIAVIATENTTATHNGGQLVLASTPNTTLTPVAGLILGQNQLIQLPAYSTDGVLVNDSSGNITTAKVANAKLANMATLTIKGNNTGGSASPIDLTVAQVNAILPVFTSTLNGLVPLSGGGSSNFLRADGTFAVPPGTGVSTTLTSAHILVGNGSNVATDVAVSGDLTLANTGAFTVAKIQSTVVSGTTGSTNVVFSGSPTIATPTFTTSAIAPLIIGGTGTTSTLALRSTSGVGAAGADIIFQTGSNGATEAARILNNGNVGIGTASPTLVNVSGLTELTVAGVGAQPADLNLQRGTASSGTSDVGIVSGWNGATRVGTLEFMAASATDAGSIALSTKATAGVLTNGLTISSTQVVNVPVQLVAHGTSTNDSAASGFIGEYVSATTATSTTLGGVSNDYRDIASISLTAGDWDVSGVIEYGANGATVSWIIIGISTTSGNSGTGLVEGDSFFFSRSVPDATQNSGLSLPGVRMSLSGTTTVYLKGRANYTVATPQCGGRISARRVR